MKSPALISKEAGLSAARLLDEMSRLFYLSRAILVAAELGVADHLYDEALAPSELAAKTGTDAAALGRLLRFLAAYGVFQQAPDGKFCQSPLSLVLHDDHPNSKRAELLRFQPFWWNAIGEMEHSIRTGNSAFEKFHSVPFFEYIRENADIQSQLDQGMAQISNADDAVIVAGRSRRRISSSHTKGRC